MAGPDDVHNLYFPEVFCLTTSYSKTIVYVVNSFEVYHRYLSLDEYD
jgi:hypothetical protein